MLIDTRRDPPPPPPPRRRRGWDLNWPMWTAVALAVALVVAAGSVSGIAGYLLALAGLATGCFAVDRAFGYWGGLSEHRQ